MDLRLIRQVIMLLVLATIAEDLSAASFRCGRKLITVGDSVGKLIGACGEPFHKERGNENVRMDGVARQARVERWYYKKSARKLEHVIIIHQGKVAAVQTGKR